MIYRGTNEVMDEMDGAAAAPASAFAASPA
jgi:hypothetical protein